MAWLRSLGVRYVALTDTAADYNGMLRLRAPRAGTVQLTFWLTLSRILDVAAGDASAGCPRP